MRGSIKRYTHHFSRSATPVGKLCLSHIYLSASIRPPATPWMKCRGGTRPPETNVVAFGRQQLADRARSVPRVTSAHRNTCCANRDFVVWTSGGNANVSSVVGRVKPMSKARDNRELYRILPKQKRPSTRSTGSLALDSHRRIFYAFPACNRRR